MDIRHIDYDMVFPKKIKAKSDLNYQHWYKKWWAILFFVLLGYTLLKNWDYLIFILVLTITSIILLSRKDNGLRLIGIIILIMLTLSGGERIQSEDLNQQIQGLVELFVGFFGLLFLFIRKTIKIFGARSKIK